MPKVILTDITIKSLPSPEKGQTTYWDDGIAGFGIRVSQGGSKSFVVVHGVNRRRETVGRYPTISLKQARAKAKKLMAEITLGVSQRKSISFKDGRALFLEACRAKNRPNTVDYYRKRLDTHFRFGRKRLEEISRLDIQSRISKIQTSAPEQNHAFVVIRTLMNWAVREQYLESSPIATMIPPGKRNVREHVLSDKELRSVYLEAQDHQYPFGHIVALLILTGQRRNEIASLQWDWIDQMDRTITFPSSLTKNKNTHVIPFGECVSLLLSNLPNLGPYLFPSRSQKGTIFNGWGKSKARFDHKIEDVDHFTLHDLRRTYSTIHAKIGTPIHVTEKLLNHMSGSISGVAAIYNRHSYLEEMREAVLNYDMQLQKLVKY